MEVELSMRMSTELEEGLWEGQEHYRSLYCRTYIALQLHKLSRKQKLKRYIQVLEVTLSKQKLHALRRCQSVRIS